MKKAILYKTIFFIVLLMCACNDNFIPKPISYPKIDFPKKTYQKFTLKTFPYQFEYPTYFNFERDTLFFGDKPDNPYWLNLRDSVLNATIYITYKSLTKNKLDKLIFDSYKITSKQIYKASAISDSVLQSDKNYDLVLYNVEGDAATTHQFFATDKKQHFIRGSLYLNSTPKEDSIKIVTDFLKQDIVHLLQTLEFKK